MSLLGKPDRWLQVDVEVPRRLVGTAETALEELGALVSWAEAASGEDILEPAPGAAPLWASVRVTALLPADTSRERVALVLAADLGADASVPGFREVLDRDWDAEWRRQLTPLRFGERLWICPADQPCPDPGGVTVLLEPGLAFGTGTHPTTAMCLTWLESLARSTGLAGRTLLDYGCGSGILAIAALALGAGSATGIDIDAQALIATRENARRNGCTGRLTAGLPAELRTATAAARFDILVANILAGPLSELAPEFRRCVGPATDVAVSGILADQAAEVAAAFSPWVTLERVAEQGGWVLLAGSVPH